MRGQAHARHGARDRLAQEHHREGRESTAFTASVEGTQEPRILWSVEGEDSGTITSTGVYTAPTQAGTYTVVATNALDTTKKDTAEVTVTPVIHVTLTPTSATVLTGGSVTFTAEVTGATDTSVTWSIQEGDAGGTLTSTGVYTAPAQGGTFTVVATSVADPTKKAEARVTVSAIIVEVSPGTATSAPGGTTTFTATVKGHTTQAVSWSVEGEARAPSPARVSTRRPRVRAPSPWSPRAWRTPRRRAPPPSPCRPPRPVATPTLRTRAAGGS
ncbi:hypothetical protein ACN28S_18380 [Cystobacter fuscus]